MQFSSIILSTALFSQIVLGAASTSEVLRPSDEYIWNAVEEIVNIPSNQQTFENTMRPWSRLVSMLSKFSHTYPSFKASTFLLQNTNLYTPMISYVQTALRENQELNAYQRYVIASFIDNCKGLTDEDMLDELKTLNGDRGNRPYIYLRGDVAYKLNPEKLTVYNLYIDDDSISSLTDRIHQINADIVCLQNLPTGDTAYSLYEKLKNTYAHFYFNILTENVPGDLCIVSKYRLENAQFTPFAADSLIHSDLVSLDTPITDYVLLPTFLNYTTHDQWDFETVVIPMNDLDGTENQHAGLLTSLRKFDTIYVNISSNNNRLAGDNVILCGGHAEASAEKDSQGNSSASAGVSISETSDNGTTYSVGASGEMSKDSEGNASAKGGFTVTIDW